MNAVNYPPHVTQSRSQILPSTALDLLQTFLTDTESSPYLHPDANLTEQGPQRSSAAEGLALHNLRRVEAGLRGERLAKNLSELNADGLLQDAGEGFEGDAILRETAAPRRTRGTDGADDGQWRDMTDYQREQGGDVGDMVADEAMQGVVDRPEIPRVKQAVKNGGADTIDKEERKRKKRERRALEKREAEEKRKRRKEMDLD